MVLGIILMFQVWNPLYRVCPVNSTCLMRPQDMTTPFKDLIALMCPISKRVRPCVKSFGRIPILDMVHILPNCTLISQGSVGIAMKFKIYQDIYTFMKNIPKSHWKRALIFLPLFNGWIGNRLRVKLIYMVKFTHAVARAFGPTLAQTSISLCCALSPGGCMCFPGKSFSLALSIWYLYIRYAFSSSCLLLCNCYRRW